MTHKQTEYDKAEKQSYKEYCDSDLRKTLDQDNEWLAHKTGFRDGYQFGIHQQMEKQKAEHIDHERNLIALGDDYMTAREKAIEDAFQKWINTPRESMESISFIFNLYRQGWNDSDAFDDEWTAQHPKALLDRLLADHPEIIENEVKARMKDIRNDEQAGSDHFRDSAKMVRYEIAKEIFTRSLTCEDAEARGWASRNIELHAKECVNYADALIKELGKEEEL